MSTAVSAGHELRGPFTGRAIGDTACDCAFHIGEPAIRLPAMFQEHERFDAEIGVGIGLDD